MRVIPPVAITPAMLTSSTIAEPDTTVSEAAWSAGTNYTTGTKVVRTAVHKVYERLAPGGTDAGLPEVTPSKWLEIAPTNRWAMFDLYRNTASTFTTSCTIVITPGVRIGSLAIMGASLGTVSVSMTSAGPTVYSKTSTPAERGVYAYDENYQDTLVLFDLPLFRNGIITIVFTVAAGSVSTVLIGNQVYLGKTRRGHTNDALNFSTIDRDIFGTSILVPRRSVLKTTQSLLVNKSNVNNVLAIRESLNAVPALWLGIDGPSQEYFRSLMILGIYKELTLSLDYPKYANCTLELEEL